MVADYKKGKDLVELLQGTHTLLQTLQQLAAPEDYRIQTKLQMVTEKQVERKKDIASARAAYRLVKRWTNAPDNAAELESIMKVMWE